MNKVCVFWTGKCSKVKTSRATFRHPHTKFHKWANAHFVELDVLFNSSRSDRMSKFWTIGMVWPPSKHWLLYDHWFGLGQWYITESIHRRTECTHFGHHHTPKNKCPRGPLHSILCTTTKPKSFVLNRRSFACWWTDGLTFCTAIMVHYQECRGPKITSVCYYHQHVPGYGPILYRDGVLDFLRSHY